MPWVWLEPEQCTTRRDCDCCGANAAKLCIAPSGHAGVHFLECQRCGKDQDCA